VKKLRFLFVLFILVQMPFFLNSQTFSGKIMDDQGTGLQGAAIQNLQKGSHTHSNEKGIFIFEEININDSLEISFIGFESKLFIVDEPTNFARILLEVKPFELDEITVARNTNSINSLATIDLAINPVNSSQEILRKVPGLFIGQHAGGGKAEQIFLRGFDLDHGTDIRLTVDGLPVNMVSHAHGQGYADLHFIIPETIQKIDFGKGPYYADKGNFATAGYVGFKTKDVVKNSTFTLESGRFNTIRSVGVFDLYKSEKHNAYIATEYLISDGPFESDQNFKRLNISGKYNFQITNIDKITFSLSHFQSDWDASGQIPERAVENNLITRFGAIDDTEGGITSRSNVSLSFTKAIDHNSFVKNKIFYSKYDFELYSNFTFFLNEPIDGDQIRQKENRNLYGFESEWNHVLEFNNNEMLVQVGAGILQNNINDIELSRTKNRSKVLRFLQLGNVNEVNHYAYISSDIEIGKLIINPGLRIDHINFEYKNQLDSLYSKQSQSASIVSPKLNLIYSQNNSLQYFLKFGKGFHSNDSRLVLTNNVQDVIPAAYGMDLGAIWKPIPRLISNISLWALLLDQEFVYVGDEGIVEPSGKTSRKGLDVSVRYQISDRWFANIDGTYTIARSTEESEGNDFIPLAPKSTLTGALTYQHKAINSSISFRHLGDRAANEQNSVLAKGYTITDFNFNYQLKKVNLGIVLENIFNVSWNEAQFLTESRLFNEPISTEEIHFTPGTPLFWKGVVKYNF